MIAFGSKAGGAQTARGPVLRLVVDNDLLAVRGAGAPPDFDYTHGTRVDLTWDRAPRLLARSIHASARCDAAADRMRGCALSRIDLGQQIFTPRHDSASHVAGDRPYVAVLFATAALMRLDAAYRHSLTLAAGTTGPPALGEQVQNGVHRLLGNRLERGWNGQLPARPVVAVDYDGARAILRGDRGAASRFVAVTWGAAAGTLRREARAGARVHYGRGAGRAWRAADALVERPGALYVAADFDEAFVDHDAVIEGDGATPGAVRRPWVGQVSAALGGIVGQLGVEYRYVLRGREYRAESGRHAYGSITLSVRP